MSSIVRESETTSLIVSIDTLRHTFLTSTNLTLNYSRAIVLPYLPARYPRWHQQNAEGHHQQIRSILHDSTPQSVWCFTIKLMMLCLVADCSLLRGPTGIAWFVAMWPEFRKIQSATGIISSVIVYSLRWWFHRRSFICGRDTERDRGRGDGDEVKLHL